MRLLVTGGAGFIGANFIKYMLAKHDDCIVNLDLLTYAGNLENLSGLEGHTNYRFVKGDIRDHQQVEQGPPGSTFPHKQDSPSQSQDCLHPLSKGNAFNHSSFHCYRCNTDLRDRVLFLMKTL